MSTNHFQPLSTLGEGCDQAGGDPQNLDPAKQDYLQGRKFFDNGDYAQAAISFHNALRGFEEQGDEQGVANAADRLGDACLAREEFAMAIANYKMAFAVCEKEDDSFSQLALNKKMAASYRKLGDMENALELLYDMLEHYRLTHNPKGAVDILILIAEVYNEQGEKGKAADTYRSVASIHERFKHERIAGQFRERAEALEQEG